MRGLLFMAPRIAIAAIQPQNRPKMPPDNLVWSIILRLFLLPLGIIRRLSTDTGLYTL